MIPKHCPIMCGLCGNVFIRKPTFGSVRVGLCWFGNTIYSVSGPCKKRNHIKTRNQLYHIWKFSHAADSQIHLLVAAEVENVGRGGQKFRVQGLLSRKLIGFDHLFQYRKRGKRCRSSDDYQLYCGP